MNKVLKHDEMFRPKETAYQGMDSSASRTPVGIRFANYLFSHPVPIDRFSLPTRSAGVCVILMPDPSWGPWHFQPLCFGEFGLQRTVNISVAQQTTCLKVAAGRSLYFSLYAAAHPHEWQILQIKKELIEHYRPVCNLESLDSASELVFKVKGLENKIIEQEAVLKLALAAIGQIAQIQQPEPKKRIAGFRPDPADSRH